MALYEDDIHNVILLSLLVPHIEEMDLGFYVVISWWEDRDVIDTRESQ